MNPVVPAPWIDIMKAAQLQKENRPFWKYHADRPLLDSELTPQNLLAVQIERSSDQIISRCQSDG